MKATQNEYLDIKQKVRVFKRNFKKAVNKTTDLIFKHFNPKKWITKQPDGGSSNFSYGRYQFRTLVHLSSIAIQNECKRYATIKGFNSRKRKNGNLY